MHGLLATLYSLVTRFGGFGLLVLYFLDSSFLFIPLGPDLLLVAVVAQKHELMPYYALMAALGSVSGSAVMDLVSRNKGEKGLERFLSQRRLHSVRKRVEKGAAWALTLASLMPPPFPFTPVVIAASALQYPRKKLLTVVGFARFGRFMIEGALGIYFGQYLLQEAHFRAVEIGVITLVVLCLAGSIISTYQWIKMRRKQAHAAT